MFDYRKKLCLIAAITISGLLTVAYTAKAALTGPSIPIIEPLLGTETFSCSCNCDTGAGTGCACSCDIDAPLPLPVYISQTNAPDVQVNVYDETVYKVLNGYLGPQGELPRGEEQKINLAQKIQGNIMNFITNKTDKICPENEKFPDTNTCRRGVENWTTVLKDIEDNAKRIFYNDLAKLNPEVIPDPLDKQILVDMLGLVVNRNPVGNLIEGYIKNAYDNQPFHITQDTETGAFIRGDIHADKAQLFAGIQQYFKSYVQEMKDNTKFAAELGGGWFGSWECIREIYNPVTDRWSCDPNGGYSYIITPGQMNTIANVLLPTLDIEAAMNSTYFTAIYDKYARLRIDSDGYITQGLLTDQALYQDDKNRLGFMMTDSLGQSKITPSCQIRAWPSEQLTLFTEGTNHEQTITLDVYLSNAEKSRTTLILPESTSILGIGTPRLVENNDYTKYTALATFSGLSAGTTTAKIAVNVTRLNDDGSETTGSCEADLAITVLPDIECVITLDEAPSGILSLSTSQEINGIVDWVDKSLLETEYYPKITKDIGFSITPSSDAGLLDLPKLLLNNFTAKLTNTQRIHNRLFNLDKPFSLLPTLKRTLKLKDLGTATIHTEVKFLGIDEPLCQADFELKAGYRCQATACPPQRGPAIEPNVSITRFTANDVCTTAFCDYHTGVRTDDWSSFNAYCLDACP